MIVSETQCFFIVLIVGAAFGARRGWGKEVVTCAIVLGALLFTLNGGGDFIASLFTRGPTGPNGAGLSSICTPTGASSTQLLSNLFFGGMAILGYSVGNKYGTSPKTNNHRLAGTIPGAVNGGAIAYYLSNNVLPGKELTLFSPSGALTTSELPIVFGFGFLALLVILFLASQTKSSK